MFNVIENILFREYFVFSIVALEYTDTKEGET